MKREESKGWSDTELFIYSRGVRNSNCSSSGLCVSLIPSNERAGLAGSGAALGALLHTLHHSDHLSPPLPSSPLLSSPLLSLLLSSLFLSSSFMFSFSSFLSSLIFSF